MEFPTRETWAKQFAREEKRTDNAACKEGPLDGGGLGITCIVPTGCGGTTMCGWTCYLGEGWQRPDPFLLHLATHHERTYEAYTSSEKAKVCPKKREIVYLRDDDVGMCSFASGFVPQHAMKPFRVYATHDLVESLGLTSHMRVLRPPMLCVADLAAFHNVDYLSNLELHNALSWRWHPSVSRVPFSADCPPVEGIVEYGLQTASGSVMGAVLLNAREADICINWSGGMHHARCGDCSGFCYINDIVLGIVELLKQHDRVLYIDIDVHHGDGVEEAFYTTDRVFTLSLHKYGDLFFPGTGNAGDVGSGPGRYCSMNLCLFDGIDDAQYTQLFDHAVRKVVERFQPSVVLMQCGADSCAGDRVGVFNLSSLGHGHCVKTVRDLGLPLLVVGGGGYTVHNVAKLWAYETAILCGEPVPPSAIIPLDKLASTRWLHENVPMMCVPSDATMRPNIGVVPPRAMAKLREQIDTNAALIPPFRPEGVDNGVKKEAETSADAAERGDAVSADGVRIEVKNEEHDDCTTPFSPGECFVDQQSTCDASTKPAGHGGDVKHALLVDPAVDHSRSQSLEMGTASATEMPMMKSTSIDGQGCSADDGAVAIIVPHAATLPDEVPTQFEGTSMNTYYYSDDEVEEMCDP